MESVHKTFLGIYISEQRNMLVAEKFTRSLVSEYGKHSVYIDVATWYPEACKIIIERVMQYFKDRIESFDDYYPCHSKRECDNSHVYNWMELFVSMYNNTIV